MSKGMKTCPSCGAQYDVTLAKCPYCGTMNYPGAEAAYFKRLKNLLGSLKGLKSVPDQEGKKQMSVSRIICLVLLSSLLGGTAIVMAMFFLITGITDASETDMTVYALKEYQHMNELYDANELEELATVYVALSDTGNASGWQYRELGRYLEKKKWIDQCLQEVEEGYVGSYSYQALMEHQLSFLFMEERESLSEEEKEKLKPYVEEIRADFESRWEITEEELETLRELMAENDYMQLDDRDILEKYVKRVYK